jgi:hypothetical protein
VQDRERLTEFFATRLIMCLARHDVYSERAIATGHQALWTIAALEVELLGEAKKDWRQMLGYWRLASDRAQLLECLTRARTKARHAAIADYDDSTTRERLLKYVVSLQLQTLVGAS